VFKVKCDGIFQSRLVACRYSQVPGVDYNKNYAPVINNVAWHILLIAKLVWKLDAMIVDIDTAFLYGELNEEIYMNLPEGMTGDNDKCLLLLNKSLYGLVQAARQWHKQFVTILKNIGFKGGMANPCLFIKRYSKGVIIILIYVDDNFCIGHMAVLTEFVKDLQSQGLSVKVSKDFSDYLSCNIQFSKDGGTAWIGQSDLICKLEEKGLDI